MGASRPGAEATVMFDGVPKANSIWVHPLIDTVNTDMAGHIDVYKSPQPVFYGNMALGVVDVVPKSMSEEGWRLRLRSGGGTYGTWFETVEAGLMAGPWDAYFVQSTRESEGHREHSAGRVNAYYFGTGCWMGDNFYLAVKGLHTDSTAQDPGPDTGPPPKRETFNNRNDTGTVALYNKFEWGEGYVKGWVDRGYNNWQEEEDDANTPWQNYGLRARQTVRLGPVELMGGVDGTFLGGEFIQVDLDGKRKASVPYDIWHLWEPYAAISVLLGDRDSLFLIPSYGYRWHQHSEFDNKESWQAGVVAGYDFFEVHANWAHGYNYPGQYSRVYYNMIWSFVPKYTGKEWKGLEPEENNHWEVGAQLTMSDKARLNVTYFNERIFNRLVVVPGVPGNPVHLDMVGELFLSGVDTSLLVTPMDNVSLYAGYTKIWEEKPDKVARTPENTMSAGLEFLVPSLLRLNVDYLMVSEQYVYNPRNPGKGGVNIERIDGYELLNAKLAFPFQDERVSGDVWVAAENLGDTDYEYLPHYPMPGTTWMGGVTLEFK
jgi:iron complex outermembrane receptor protein